MFPRARPIPHMAIHPTKPLTATPDSPAAAVRAMIERIRPVEVQTIPLEHATGRILAEDAATDRSSPASDVSAMDGYALRRADMHGATTLPIAGELMIGRAPTALPPGACLRIVTGAPVPPEADAVVKREDVTESPDAIRFTPDLAARVRAGENIRRRGDNGPPGTLIARAGARVTPALAGALATFGHADVRVHRPVRVAVISTGDEVLDVRATPTDWQLRDSNGPTLRALIAANAWAEVAMIERVGDDESLIRRTLAAAVERCDAVLLSGGVSMGHRDFVPDAIRAVGGMVIYHKLPQRPGKPMLGAAVGDSRVIFGLPGNPMSVLVTAVRIALPVLRALAGATNPIPDPRAVVIADPDAKSAGLWWSRPVRICEDGRACIVAAQGSGDVVSIANSNGFVEFPPGASGPGPWPYYPWTG